MQKQVRVSYLGPEGTYTHQAAAAKFKDQATYIPCGTITSTLESLCQEEADYACIPLENSLHGSVIETLDLLRMNRGTDIMGEFTMGIEHCLVTRQGVRMEEIKNVLSHEQALGQCQKFLSTNLPTATQVRTSSTASAAQQLLHIDGELSRQSAAICSRICADLYDELEVLQSSIQDGEINFTRFIILSKFPLPSELQPDILQRALLRCVLPTQTTEPSMTLSSIIKKLPNDLELTRADRRPSLSEKPFHDCTFFEIVCQRSLASDGDHRQVWRNRVDTVVRAINEELASKVPPCCYVLGAW